VSGDTVLSVDNPRVKGTETRLQLIRCPIRPERRCTQMQANVQKVVCDFFFFSMKNFLCPIYLCSCQAFLEI